jgi:hypothetical protein
MYNFYLSYFFIWQNDSNVVHKIYIFLYSFMKIYERYIRFVKNVIVTVPNEQMIKNKVVDLQKIYNFVVELFKFELILSTESAFGFLKFENLFFQTISNWETIKVKVVDLEKLYNFVVYNFFYMKSYCQSKTKFGVCLVGFGFCKSCCGLWVIRNQLWQSGCEKRRSVFCWTALTFKKTSLTYKQAPHVMDTKTSSSSFLLSLTSSSLTLTISRVVGDAAAGAHRSSPPARGCRGCSPARGR